MELKNLIGKGLSADVYEYEGRAIKLFHPNYDKTLVFCEAAVTSMVEKNDLPTPKIYDVKKIGDQWAIIMDLIEGVPVAYDMGNNLDDFVDLQIKMHEIDLLDIFLPSNSHYICRRLIETDKRHNPALKIKLLKLLDSLPIGNKLCHNDYHGLNVVKNRDGLSIIDWTSATSGNPESDCCRTYMVTKINHEQFAEPYLNSYCTKRKISSACILRWLPIMSAEWIQRDPENPLLIEWLSQC